MKDIKFGGKCPRCSGKMYAGYEDEAYCIICGYVEYANDAPKSNLRDASREDSDKILSYPQT